MPPVEGPSHKRQPRRRFASRDFGDSELILNCSLSPKFENDQSAFANNAILSKPASEKITHGKRRVRNRYPLQGCAKASWSGRMGTSIAASKSVVTSAGKSLP